MQRPYLNSMCALGLLTLLVTGCGSLDPTDTAEDSDTGDNTDRAPDVYSRQWADTCGRTRHFCSIGRGHFGIYCFIGDVITLARPIL